MVKTSILVSLNSTITIFPIFLQEHDKENSENVFIIHKKKDNYSNLDVTTVNKLILKGLQSTIRHELILSFINFEKC